MASAADPRRRCVAFALALLGGLTACSTDQPTPSPSWASVASASPGPSGSVEPAPSSGTGAGLVLPDAGQPFDPATLLDAMRTSRRPGGVPDELETEAIATQLANAIWTIDGEPWATMAIGGSCGPQSCSLEVAGSGPASTGEDLWAFDVDPATGEVRLASGHVAALPPELVGSLDELARELVGDDSLEDMALGSARWAPPPAPEGQFVLSYRSGGEEGSCGIDLTLDAAGPAVTDRTSVGC